MEPGAGWGKSGGLGNLLAFRTLETTMLGQERWGKGSGWVCAGIRVPVIPRRGVRCVATAYVCTLMGILSVMTSGSMPTPLTFTPLAGLRRLGTNCSPPKVRPSWVAQVRQRALRSSLPTHGSPSLFPIP